MKGLLIALSLDYGAEEYLWYSNFTNTKDLIQWWKDLKSSDIYKNQLNEIIDINEITLVDDNDKWDIFYSCTISIMLENDKCSYLMIDRNRYNFIEKI